MIVIDDHPSFRRTAIEMLRAVGYEVVGEAATGREGVAAVEASDPDVVLLDVQLPDIDGFEVLRLLDDGTRSPKVVLVSTRSAEDYATRLENASAAGFVSKVNLDLTTLRTTLDRIS